MSSSMMTPEEYKAMLKEIHNRVIDNLLQCGMVMETVLNENETMFRVLPLEGHSMREFIDVLAGGLMPLKIEMVIPDTKDVDPQVVYNCLTIMERTSCVMLDTFFSMAHRAYENEREKWEEAKRLSPGAAEALELMFRKKSGEEQDPGEIVARLIERLARQRDRKPEEMMSDALDGLKASIMNMVDPPKTTN